MSAGCPRERQRCVHERAGVRPPRPCGGHNMSCDKFAAFTSEPSQFQKLVYMQQCLSIAIHTVHILLVGRMLLRSSHTFQPHGFWFQTVQNLRCLAEADHVISCCCYMLQLLSSACRTSRRSIASNVANVSPSAQPGDISPRSRLCQIEIMCIINSSSIRMFISVIPHLYLLPATGMC